MRKKWAGKKAQQLGNDSFGLRRDTETGNWARDAVRATVGESGNTGRAAIDASYIGKSANVFDTGKLKRVRGSGEFY